MRHLSWRSTVSTLQRSTMKVPSSCILWTYSPEKWQKPISEVAEKPTVSSIPFVQDFRLRSASKRRVSQKYEHSSPPCLSAATGQTAVPLFCHRKQRVNISISSVTTCLRKLHSYMANHSTICLPHYKLASRTNVSTSFYCFNLANVVLPNRWNQSCGGYRYMVVCTKQYKTTVSVLITAKLKRSDGISKWFSWRFTAVFGCWYTSNCIVDKVNCTFCCCNQRTVCKACRKFTII